MRKVAICVPARDSMAMETAQCLVALVGQFTVDYVATGQAMLRYYFMNGTLLPDMRNGLVRAALADEATHILWVDTDMKFPKDALARLLKHDAPMIGANYVQRKRPCKPTAAHYGPDGGRYWMYTAPEGVEQAPLEPAESMGHGLMLVEASVYECTPEPWYSLPWVAAKKEHVGEDVFFFRTVKKHLDIEPMVDNVLSREVEHIGFHNYVWQDAYDDHHLLMETTKAAAE